MADGRTVDVQTLLNEHPSSGYQQTIFALCFCIILLDGFDTAAISSEIARLRALLNPDAAQARAETKQQMKDLKTALLALLDQPQPAHSRSATSHWPACAVKP